MLTTGLRSVLVRPILYFAPPVRNAMWRAGSSPVLKCWWNQPSGGAYTAPSPQFSLMTLSPWPSRYGVRPSSFGRDVQRGYSTAEILVVTGDTPVVEREHAEHL